MKHAKRIITILIITILTISAVFISYIGIENGAVVFAEDVHFMTDQELETAYQAYLQSKGGGLIGNAGARYAYTTGKMLNFITSDANTTGITTIDELKSQMTWQKQYLENGNGYLSLGITNRGMGLLNLYTQYLMQQHYFGNGVNETDGMFDDGIDNTLYSGKYFTDDDGNTCLVYITDQFFSSYAESTIGQFNVKYGTPYKYTGDEINTLYTNGTRSLKFNINETEYSYGLSVSSGWLKFSGAVVYYRGTNSNYKANGNPAIVYNRNDGKFYIGSYSSFNMNNAEDSIAIEGIRVITSNNNNTNDANIIFYTNNNNNVNVYPTINEGDNLYITPKVNVGVDGEVNYQPYIINEGDTITNVVNNYYTDSGTKDKTITVPSDDPTGGVGGGGSSDGPTGGNPPNWSNPFPHLSPDGEGGFNFNFQLPDLNIDWNISGLTEKFPFSIPFDFVAFCQVLDAEPETPSLQCDIDLKLVTWHVDYDLHQFDNIASLLRNLEFIAFCIALVIMTRNMIKG